MKISVPILFAASAVCLSAQSSRSGQVRLCSQISLARPGFGASYRGTVRNDDYRVSLTIPDGLTGWGAGPVAPFHGFTIFLPSDDDQSICIIFEIHLRVDIGQPEAKPRGEKITVGGIAAWQEETTGTIDGKQFTNIAVRFSVVHRKEVDDGTVWLVTRTKDLSRDRPIFERFLAQTKFYRQ
jgi:hypothetical protein